jgi:hypothetical protein
MDGGISSAAQTRVVAAALSAMAMRWLIPSQTRKQKTVRGEGADLLNPEP